MSGSHEEDTAAAAAPARADEPSLVDSVPLFPAGTPPVPPLPTSPSPEQPPAYRRTRAAAREDRRTEPPTDADASLFDTIPRSALPARRVPDDVPPPTTDVAQPTPPRPPQVAAAPVVPDAVAPSVPGLASAQSASRRERADRERHSFLQTERPEEPAREGVRGVLNRLGLRMKPSPSEQAARDDELEVSQHWPGPRTIAVVNGKGGAGKTPTTILLSAVFARYGGAGVLAWDNNQTRGTLGWRTDSGAHDRTLLEMLPEVGRLLGTGAQSADLAHFMHHQPREKYDVLRSKPIRLAHENRLSPSDVDAIHAVAAKFYRLIIIDSGNDESDPMWLRMIDHSDQLVIATTTRDDHAEAGALLIEALEERDERSARLARQSVVVVSQADPKATQADVDHVVGGYRSLARDVVSIPFDQEMVDGHLRYGALAKRTQRAWLAAAASVARGF